jgi:hypothetical protein
VPERAESRTHDELHVPVKIATAMPPGPAYNWLCVLHSATEILSLVARHRATQIVTSPRLNSRKRRRTEETVDIPVSVDHARSAEKSSGHEPIVNASSITQNVDMQSEVLILLK